MNGFTPRFPLRSSTTVYQFCQSDQEKLKETFSDKKLEVIVDDASHDEDKTMTSLQTLFPLLTNGAYYFIEDLWWSFCTKIGDWLQTNRQDVESMQVFS